MDNKTYLNWIEFNTKFADELVKYKDNRIDLVNKIKNVFNKLGMRIPKFEEDGSFFDIDPFSVIALVYKGITNNNRIRLVKALVEEFEIKMELPLPISFEGVPLVNNLKAVFFPWHHENNEINNLWELFLAAISYASSHSTSNQESFVKSFNTAIHQQCVKWNITMALYWIRPYTYVNMDGRNRWYIEKYCPELVNNDTTLFKNVPSGDDYLNACVDIKNTIINGEYSFANIPELSYESWEESERINQLNKEAEEKVPSIEDDNETHYWLYAPGHNADRWDDFYSRGIMAIGWGEIGDLNQYSSKKQMKDAMKSKIDPDKSFKNDSHATWQFSRDMKKGDIVFVKKGMYSIVGRGVVTSDYKFVEDEKDYYNNIREVDWTHNGVWKHPGQAVLKTLTDITSYTDYVEELNALFEVTTEEEIEDVEKKYPAYNQDQFLSEVYMNDDDYHTLVNLVHTKKNVILQGAPGVGKTYIAKRLAYSIMGEQDPNRVKMVQFHQSYSYEDFIMGYRPNADGGFVLKTGPFYDFCKKAEIDSDNEYFFIIDEINRGNLSKIFGELFMLIENDKRDKVKLQLLYADEKFSVPSNLYIIGMMNTADRSLAMLDYALRRRFAFFDIPPAFNSEGFTDYQESMNNPKFDKLIGVIKMLNEAISNDDTLGDGFRIGHSYFCNQNSYDDMQMLNIIDYEIIPLLREYWFDEPAKIKEWSNMLRSAIK